ncbi:Inter alpha-trypsin inhibitor, heavy chain [Thalictrum thalictroides]|uniref:Inter alpha-trypsin inhibitor, heavy chain n=1 Tax=Thalictrum thalictroides TaxID=46969 RepID=A0A7J6UUN4_THATH|nr:Inter alpha-trypsin inhibitor, heavy chain [Thalictrum thalictroides]
MAEEFVKSVEDGLKLSKRVYFGNDRSVAPPKPISMYKSEQSHLPTAPMIYAVISDPGMVDNPDVPSYQPHVHGRCDPPALIPLQMNKISVEADCYLDTAFVTVTGSWRVHCVMGSRSCDCRLVIPMGEQGSILGVEIDVNRRSYSTQLVSIDGQADTDKLAKEEDGGFLKPQMYTLTIRQVEGGSNLSVKVSWSQKLLYDAGQLTLNVPFDFPEYVTPAGKKFAKREKIQLNVNSGTASEVLCKTTSHPFKETRRQVGKLGFLYEADVLTWSSTNISFSYVVSSSDTLGGLLLQSPSVHDLDQREIFCLYLFPGNNNSKKVFRKQVVFLVDSSESMRGTLLENVKSALNVALSKLNPEDSFNIIAFNGETHLFLSSLELATKETIEKALQWISINLIAGGGTNILLPLNQAMEMLSNTSDTVPLIFLITDGSVEDERDICNFMKKQLANRGSISPRISTFGIGKFCNHYFLQMLALIGRGYYDAAFDLDAIEVRMQSLFTAASNIILANITIDSFEHLEAFEAYPSQIPDLSSGCPLIVSGRYQGKFPDVLKARGTKADLSNFVIDLKLQRAKDIPLERVYVKQQINLLTAQAWLSQSKQLEDKVAKISIQFGFSSENTRMILLQTEEGKQASQSVDIQEIPNKVDLQELVDSRERKIVFLKGLGIGFGDLDATAKSISPRFGDSQLPEIAGEVFINAASNCCNKLANCCCCYCCIRVCSHMNNQCMIALTQLCSALACLGCFSCYDICCD